MLSQKDDGSADELHAMKNQATACFAGIALLMGCWRGAGRNSIYCLVGRSVLVTDNSKPFI
jgi:hypothetical protein